jgi:hypothetical protein
MGALQNSPLVVVGGALVVAVALGVGARQMMTRPAGAKAPGTAARLSASGNLAAPVLHIPHTPGSITLDGDTDDQGWTQPPGPARTGPFLLPNGVVARPNSNARLVWGDGHLYLSLFAADEDIRTRTDQPDGPLWLDDYFHLVFVRGSVEYAIDVSPRGVVTDAVRKSGGVFDYSWSSGAHVSPELDGTLNNDKDMDEEWVIEMAIPFESLGLKGESGERIGFSVTRCDTPKEMLRICAGWGEVSADSALGTIVLD